MVKGACLKKIKLPPGLAAAMASSVFLGLAPVMGKLAIHLGLPPLFVAALRTGLAGLLMLVLTFLFKRQYLYIYPAGLLGCIIAGWLNGMGSLLYYAALGRIEASLGQVVYSLYPLFVAMWMMLEGQKPSRLTVFRMAIVLPALLLLMDISSGRVDVIGVLMMLGSSLLYALHLPVNQRVLLDMPAPTVTMYTLLAMSATVLPALFFVSFSEPPQSTSWLALLALTAVTFLSRLTLFLGVKHLGGLQTALLGLGELLITIMFSHWLLGERLSLIQWGGVLLLMFSLFLTIFEKPTKRRGGGGGWLNWLRPAGMPSDLILPRD
ncbi:MAG: DMT family transporter [Chloroflexota bacterium]